MLKCYALHLTCHRNRLKWAKLCSKCNEWDNVKKLWNVCLIAFSWLKGYFFLKDSPMIYMVHVPYVYGKPHSSLTNVGKNANNWWKCLGQYKMEDCLIWCIIRFGVKCIENQDNLCLITKHLENRDDFKYVH